MSNFNFFLFAAAINGFLAVTFGAFGSHALKARLTEQMISVWQTSVQYHFYHVFALALIALLYQKGIDSIWLKISGWSFLAGIVLFCGSLYWLALGGPKLLGPITPLGGLCFLIAWACLAISAVKGH